ncbi:MAG: hypothetical protein KDJ26_01520 [Alphaproteobacteria bacterium]|nr:hypothetical protein [Alphaproteobacteria bacterium]MCB9985732.1 hypothetical protein [Micavibrio sp.]HPQ50414.1 hypothetical protein [Alphaproteobacteria bacterium]
MRALLLILVGFMLSVPAYAAETSSKPSLVKGSKSYQSRSVPTDGVDSNNVQSIEPAAGGDVSDEQGKIASKVGAAQDETAQDIKTKPQMVLHGKK